MIRRPRTLFGGSKTEVVQVTLKNLVCTAKKTLHHYQDQYVDAVYRNNRRLQ